MAPETERCWIALTQVPGVGGPLQLHGCTAARLHVRGGLSLALGRGLGRRSRQRQDGAEQRLGRRPGCRGTNSRAQHSTLLHSLCDRPLQPCCKASIALSTASPTTCQTSVYSSWRAWRCRPRPSAVVGLVQAGCFGMLRHQRTRCLTQIRFDHRQVPGYVDPTFKPMCWQAFEGRKEPLSRRQRTGVICSRTGKGLTTEAYEML